LKSEDIDGLFTCPNLVFMANNSLAAIKFLKKITLDIEKKVKSQVKMKKEFEMLRTIPGIGNILGLTIMLEVGDIARFPKVGDYSSYCRCVESKRISNGKKKGENNKKNGNKYLSWAYVEAAQFSRRYCVKAQSFYQSKEAKTKSVVAVKALSNKLSKASYYIMRDQVAFDEDKLFS
jgi:transposase